MLISRLKSRYAIYTAPSLHTTPQGSSYSLNRYRTYTRQNLSAGLRQSPLTGTSRAVRKRHPKDQQVLKNQVVIELYKGNSETGFRFEGQRRNCYDLCYGSEIDIVVFHITRVVPHHSGGAINTGLPSLQGRI